MIGGVSVISVHLFVVIDAVFGGVFMSFFEVVSEEVRAVAETVRVAVFLAVLDV